MPIKYNSYMLTKIITNNFFYIGFLIFSVSGLLLADWKYSIALFSDNRRLATLKATGIVMGLLLLFDVIGVVNNIFSTNQSFVSGLHVLSVNLPIEEFIFLFLLCYFCLLLYITIKSKLNLKDRKDV